MKTYTLKLHELTAMTSDAYQLGKRHGTEKAEMERRHDEDRVRFLRDLELEADARSAKAAP